MRRGVSHSHALVWLFLLFLSLQCSIRYDRVIQKTENYFFQGDFAAAVDRIRPLAHRAKKKDRLLYLLEAALIFHTRGDYAQSNELFIQADQLSESIKKSISKEALAFLLSDNEKNYKGESFERVLIKFYISLNYLLMNDLESARRYLKKLQFDLKDLKHFDSAYKQNLLARYLTAILSERFENYNDARVEYKNIGNFYKNKKRFNPDRLVLAMKEQDTRDIRKYRSAKNKLKAYNTSLEKVPYHTKMGELIVIHQAGKSMVKRSRGRLKNDKAFIASLHVAVRAATLSRGIASSVSGAMSTLYSAENPVPVYKFRDARKSWHVTLFLNQQEVGSPFVLNDYSQTAVQNFNDNYQKIVAKNTASIALKAISATVAAYAVDRAVGQASENAAVGAIAGIMTGFFAGSIAGATVKPDLRCWRLLPSNFQVSRIFLEPGEYGFEIKPKSGERILTRNDTGKITIKKGGLMFLNVRTI